MNSIFQFGEHHDSYAIKVINEREARAGAGILLFCAMVAFMQAWLTGNFNPTKIVVIGFFIDFFIRVIINPRFSPSLILGRFAVNNQTPEYVGAAQKRLAWGLGLGLASLMMVMLVIYDVRGPVNIIVCLVCLILLFFETAFGICLGCKLYNLIYKDSAQLCPGGVCEIKQKESIQTIGKSQIVALILFTTLFALALRITHFDANNNTSSSIANHTNVNTNGVPSSIDLAEQERCKVPAFARLIGHEKHWKEQNGCK